MKNVLNLEKKYLSFPDCGNERTKVLQTQTPCQRRQLKYIRYCTTKSRKLKMLGLLMLSCRNNNIRIMLSTEQSSDNDKQLIFLTTHTHIDNQFCFIDDFLYLPQLPLRLYKQDQTTTRPCE